MNDDHLGHAVHARDRCPASDSAHCSMKCLVSTSPTSVGTTAFGWFRRAAPRCAHHDDDQQTSPPSRIRSRRRSSYPGLRSSVTRPSRRSGRVATPARSVDQVTFGYSPRCVFAGVAWPAVGCVDFGRRDGLVTMTVASGTTAYVRSRTSAASDTFISRTAAAASGRMFFIRWTSTRRSTCKRGGRRLQCTGGAEHHPDAPMSATLTGMSWLRGSPAARIRQPVRQQLYPDGAWNLCGSAPQVRLVPP